MKNQSKSKALFDAINSMRMDIKLLFREVKNENAVKLYTKVETAKILRISVRTLNNYMTKNKIHPTFHTRGVRFTQKEIDRYITENTIH